jgi:hypothetical protein
MVSVIGLGIFLGVARSDVGEKLKRDKRTEEALARAKQALIDYAIQFDQKNPGTTAGRLPCPDVDGNNGDGSVSTIGNPCRSTNISALGRFPWRSLGMEDIRDGSGECLWYAVSGSFKNIHPKTDVPFNWDITGQFEIYAEDKNPPYITKVAGSNADNMVAAVIIAPGAVLSGQVRSLDANAQVCGGNYVAANYLDTENVSGINNGQLAVPPAANASSQFIQAKESNTFNDRLVYITAADIFTAIERRPNFYGSGGIVRSMLKMAADCIAASPVATNKLIWASDNTLANFGSLQSLKVAANYTSFSALAFGRVPLASVPVQAACGNPPPPPSLNLDAWWDEWKDQFFYVVAQGQTPASPPGDCTPNSCLTINPSSTKYAGVVLFGGSKLGAGSRVTVNERIDVAKYLDGTNATIAPGPMGWNVFSRDNSPGNPSLNDLTYCILPNLSTAPCPP